MTYTIIPISPARAPISKADIKNHIISPRSTAFAVGLPPPVIEYQHESGSSDELSPRRKQTLESELSNRSRSAVFRHLLKQDASPEKH